MIVRTALGKHAQHRCLQRSERLECVQDIGRRRHDLFFNDRGKAALQIGRGTFNIEPKLVCRGLKTFVLLARLLEQPPDGIRIQPPWKARVRTEPLDVISVQMASIHR